MSIALVPALLTAVFVLVGCAAASTRPTHQPQRVLTLLHTNDLHGHLEPWQGWEGELAGLRIGGADRLSAAIAQLRALRGAQNVLLLDAGDAFSDTMLADLTQGQAVLQVMNALHYDAMTVGNHEPDFGSAALRETVRRASFPVVAANLKTASGELLTHPFVIKQVAGIRVGIIGLAYPNTPLTTAKINVADLRFDPDPAGVLTRTLPALRSQGAQLVIVLSHLGLGADRKLAQSVHGIDVIVSGHSHNRMTRPMQVGRTRIVQAGAHGSDLGVLDLVLEGNHVVDARRELIVLDHARVGSDPGMNERVEQLAKPYRDKMKEKIGEASASIIRAQTLAGDEPRNRDQQSPADCLFADILRQETGSDVALLPGVGYGVAIPAGPIPASALRNLVPHDSKVVTMTLSGQQLHDILEQSVENTFTSDTSKRVGGMIQVSGLRFVYDPDAQPGARVSGVTVNAQQLDPMRAYRVATNAMLAEGGHRYGTFLEGRDRQEHQSEYEMLAGWMKRRARFDVPSDQRIIRQTR